MCAPVDHQLIVPTFYRLHSFNIVRLLEEMIFIYSLVVMTALKEGGRDLWWNIHADIIFLHFEFGNERV